MVRVYKNMLGDNSKIHGDTIAFEDVSNTFTLTNAQAVVAYKIGKLLIFRLTVQTGNSRWGVVASTSLKPVIGFPLSLHYGSSADTNSGTTFYMDSSGQILINFNTAPTNTIHVSGAIIIE